METSEHPPFIENERQARALGRALKQVVHIDPDWAARVFRGDPSIQYNTGPEVLNKELQSMWSEYWTYTERKQILVLYVAEMIE